MQLKKILTGKGCTKIDQMIRTDNILSREASHLGSHGSIYMPESRYVLGGCFSGTAAIVWCVSLGFVCGKKNLGWWEEFGVVGRNNFKEGDVRDKNYSNQDQHQIEA